MSESQERYEQVLQRLIGETPPPDSSGGFGSTVRLLVAIGAAWPGPLSSDLSVGLEAICRKLAVTGKVLMSYDNEWRRATDATLLTAQNWPILIALLLAGFKSEEAVSEDSLGLELKRLNAAYMAIDISKGLDDVAHLTELQAWADERLAELAGV